MSATERTSECSKYLWNFLTAAIRAPGGTFALALCQSSTTARHWQMSGPRTGSRATGRISLSQASPLRAFAEAGSTAFQRPLIHAQPTTRPLHDLHDLHLAGCHGHYWLLRPLLAATAAEAAGGPAAEAAGERAGRQPAEVGCRSCRRGRFSRKGRSSQSKLRPGWPRCNRITGLERKRRSRAMRRRRRRWLW